MRHGRDHESHCLQMDMPGMTQCLPDFLEHPFLALLACSDCDGGHANGEPDTHRTKYECQYDQDVIDEGGKHDTTPFLYD